MLRYLFALLFALLCVPAAGAAPKPTATPVLAVECGDLCVAGDMLVADGTGFNPRVTYGGCIDGPTSPGCFGLTNGVSPDGAITSTVHLSAFSVPGQYTWRIVHWQGSRMVTDATASFTLNPPAPAP